MHHSTSATRSSMKSQSNPINFLALYNCSSVCCISGEWHVDSPPTSRCSCPMSTQTNRGLKFIGNLSILLKNTSSVSYIHPSIGHGNLKALHLSFGGRHGGSLECKYCDLAQQYLYNLMAHNLGIVQIYQFSRDKQPERQPTGQAPFYYDSDGLWTGAERETVTN